MQSVDLITGLCRPAFLRGALEMARRCTTATPIGVGLIMWSVCVAAPVSGSTLLVSNTFDHGPGSLRDAIASAAPGDTIQASVGGTITLTGGPLVVRQDLSIVGPGAASLTIAGSGSSRVFTVDVAIVSISGVTISNGRSDYGGAILSGGRMTLTDCVLSSNAATMFGGAIFNSGTLMLVRSLVSNNVAEYRAGAIYSETGSTLTLDHATLSGNSSSVGGAIDNHDGTLSITASTLSGNVATGVHGGAGGAIHNGGLAGTVTIVGSTIASNVAAFEGGGIYTGSGTVIVENSTIANNTSTCDFGGCSGGGGIYTNSAPVSISSSTFSNNTSRTGGSIISLYSITTVRNSIIVAGASGPNCYTYFNNEIVSAGNNVSDDMSCAAFFTQAGDLNGVAAGLSPSGLQDNGGPTATIALLATSPAVDTVSVGACAAEGARLTTDQRGMPRPSGDACDSGAFELTLYPTTLTLSAASPASLTAGSPGPVTFTATLTQRDSAAPVAGATIAWLVDGAAMTSTTSAAEGVATLSYDPSSLAAGDHTVRASFTRQTIGGVAFDATASLVGSFRLEPPPYAALVKPPIQADGTSVFKGNRGVVPVKFTLTYNGANTCDLVPATIALFQTAGTVVGPVTLSTYTLAADNGSNFKVDATACQYVYNLSTASLASGTYSVKILIGGTIVGAGTFGVR